jgi:methyl-accepting chemotaxis protein
MQQVADRAGDDAESSLQVVASSRQQMAGMEQIGQAIVSINQATAQSVSGTRQVEKEVRQLQDLAISLRSLVEHQAKSKKESAPENPEE